MRLNGFMAGFRRGVLQAAAVVTPSVPSLVATYNQALLLTSALFQVRFHAADTDVTDAIWSDFELLYCLQQAGQVAELAAAIALEAAAADRAQIAIITLKGKLGNDERQVSANLLAMAARLRSVAPILPVVISNAAVFTTGDPAQGTRGTMDIW